jgi:hypothetical protein
VEDLATVVQHGFWRDVAWHFAIPYAEYVKAASGAVQHPTGA